MTLNIAFLTICHAFGDPVIVHPIKVNRGFYFSQTFLKLDIIYTRNATESIRETRIMVKNERLRIIDVGGHRHLRIHWKSHFDDVKAILFVVAISSYNQVMEEDGETKRMVDAIALFDQIINDPAFKQTSIILLLNKMDLFEEKIKTVHVKDYFDAFDGIIVKNIYQLKRTF